MAPSLEPERAVTEAPSTPVRRALRGRLLTFLDDPAEVGDAASHRYVEDGLLVIEDGRIVTIGEAHRLLPTLPAGTAVDHWPDCLILPGLIDTHIHLPQTQVIASFGAQLLDWLQNYTFVEEQRFADPAHSERIASFFLDELARNGTTTAVVYGSVHTQSVEAFFAESERRGTRMIAGKVMMDRGAPQRPARHPRARPRRERGADRTLARARPPALRDLSPFRADLERRPARGGGGARCRRIPTATSRPTCPRTWTRSPRSGACSHRPRTIPTSTTASASWARARSSATASI